VEYIAPAFVLFPGMILIGKYARHRRRALHYSRIAVFVIFGLFQLGIAALMRIGHFPIISAAALLPLIAPEVWEWLGRRQTIAAGRKITVFYDPDCGFCRRSCLLIRAFLLPLTTRIVPAVEGVE